MYYRQYFLSKSVRMKPKEIFYKYIGINIIAPLANVQKRFLEQNCIILRNEI